MRTDELDFDLPPELIAQEPAARRTDARMLHYTRSTGTIAHRRVSDLPELLGKNDVLVFNETAVVPARFTVVKPSGGRIEGLWLATEPHFPCRRGRVLLKGLGNFVPGVRLAFDNDANHWLQVLHKRPNDGYEVEASDRLDDLIARLGRMPLPPYIKRSKGSDPRDALDRERYQSVLVEDANARGKSVAAPTASLHFDDKLLRRLDAKGVDEERVELVVGLGTFKPVEVDDLDDHPMHRERWFIEEYAANGLRDAQRLGKRLIAVGTTACRTLESQPPGPISDGEGETDLLIQPPYAFKHVGALLTNFHLPRSTLIALVDAFVGTDARRRIYGEAIGERYRFFSYGDCMFVE